MKAKVPSALLTLIKLPLLFILIATIVPVLAMPAHILLLRHGEKPKKGPELSPLGWERAEKLPLLFKEGSELSKYGNPAALYAMGPNRAKGSVRAIQTLKYVSEKLSLPINSRYMRNSYHDLIEEIRNDPKLNGKFIVICWEHKVLTEIAAALGVANAPKYSGKKFDRLWIVDLTNSKTPVLKDLPQHLLATDSEN